jgi:hypothetical protein
MLIGRATSYAERNTPRLRPGSSNRGRYRPIPVSVPTTTTTDAKVSSVYPSATAP